MLPPVPLRQWVFTLPHPLRARLAYDAPLLGAVTRLFVDSVLGWYLHGMPVNLELDRMDYYVHSLR